MTVDERREFRVRKESIALWRDERVLASAQVRERYRRRESLVGVHDDRARPLTAVYVGIELFSHEAGAVAPAGPKLVRCTRLGGPHTDRSDKRAHWAAGIEQRDRIVGEVRVSPTDLDGLAAVEEGLSETRSHTQ
ncbi:MAG: hypothetical protein WKF96_08615 [Solirubrobacteraceae bacterium]